MLVGLGVLAPAGGCGGPEEGTQVQQVDKEKEDVMLKAMGGFMEEQSKGTKGKMEGRAKKDQ
ncbi:MAG: hypothetical protein WKF75_15440 [Singulisphaera sp.]